MTAENWARLLTANNLLFLGSGLWVSLQLAIFGIALSFGFGTLLGIARFSRLPVLSQAAEVYVEAVRNLPLLVVIFFMRFGTPYIGIKFADAFYAGLAGLTVFTSAVIAEIVRGGLQSIEKGQWEAARSQGFNFGQTLWHIVLPQAMRRMIPPLVSQFITLTKDTSYVQVISVKELTSSGRIISSQDNNPLETFALIAVLYFVINYGMSIVARRLERRLAGRSF